MPSALVTALAAPLHELAAQVGPGWSAAAHPSTMLAEMRDQLIALAGATTRVWDGDIWAGDGGAAAARYTAETADTVRALADRVGALSDDIGMVADAIARARARLRDIIAEFEARASALEPHLDAPGVAGELSAEAGQAVQEATAVLDALRAELDTHTSTINGIPRPAVTPPPEGVAGPIPAGSGFPAPIPAGAGVAPVGAGLGTALTGALSAARPVARHRAAAVGNPADFGSGVAVRLPDGSTATAPNPVAASAVRHALTQLGVPYQWGGTTPGAGLDCSGLTQWAYREAGLDIPRLAQEQDIGRPVDASSLRPGDLAVWDGHVAMIVSGDQMIEAGDPVQLSAIRTTNAGQGFQGFWRPTG